MREGISLGLPFNVNSRGRVEISGGEEALRQKMVQVLFTAPGERVHQPDFGCGLFNLVFEPNNPVLAAALEFTIGQALSRWLGNELTVHQVQAEADSESVVLEIVYTRKRDLARQAVRIAFK